MRPASRWLVIGLLLLPRTPAQGLVLRDDILLQSHMVAWDHGRGRLIELGRQGETREFDGTQ